MESFSHGASGYNEAYTKTMARICGQVEEQKELAIETLMWIVYAERLLTCEELVHVLATEPDDLVFHDDNIPDIEDVMSACCGLLILEEKTRLVRLVHRTAQEYFNGDGRSWLPGAQTKLSKVCNAYLNFVKPVGNQTLSDEAFKDILSQFPFYNYASLHWLEHMRLRETPITMKELLNQQEQVNTSSQTFLERLIPNYLKLCGSTSGITGLHLVAYHGLVELLPPFLERYDVNSVDKFRNTALSYAVQRNHKEAAKLLIDNGARLDIPDSDGLIPLYVAMEEDYNDLAHRDGARDENMVQIILDRTQFLTYVGKQGQSPLHYAL